MPSPAPISAGTEAGYSVEIGEDGRTTITGPAVTAHLASLAADMAKDTSPRMWECFGLPGITAKIFTEAAFEVGVAKRVVLPDLAVDLWPKIGEVSGPAWRALRDACARRLGIPDYEAWRRARPIGAAHEQWRTDLRRYQAEKRIREVGRGD
jgi:hypothetical protein